VSNMFIFTFLIALKYHDVIYETSSSSSFSLFLMPFQASDFIFTYGSF
jgi:hypothetical protein